MFKTIKKRSITFILSALIVNMLFILSACGGGGGGGGGVIPTPDPPGPVPGPPAAITNLSAAYGSKFGDITISFSAPAPAPPYCPHVALGV
ncbi:MAG TPA: hypothetical protein PK467_13850, partial [Candidatus Wallbacteria bacterium]|nr:hypothetical protein [Candidatus Wallbacteria bacterium]